MFRFMGGAGTGLFGKIVPILIIAALVLAACPPPAEPPVEAPPAPVEEEPVEEPTPEEPEVVEPKVLRIGHPQRPNDFNPLAVIQGIQTWLARYVFSKLITYDHNNELIGDLAEEWTFSDDGTEFTFKLREGVTWHDGEPFTAEDVVFTFHYLLNPAAGARAISNFQIIEGAEAYGEGETENVSGITANGDYEVIFKLEEPSAVFLNDLSAQSIMPRHVVEAIAPEDFATSSFATERPYPGTGPFMFERYITDQFVELHANPSYFRGAPQIDRMIIESIPDHNTRIVALERGDLDLIQFPNTELERLEEQPDLRIIRQNIPVITVLAVDSDQEKDDPKKVAMRTPEFRKALLHALDMEALITDVQNDLVVRQVCMFLQDWACADGLNDYSYDPDQARAYLEEIDWDPAWEVDWMILAAQVEPLHAIQQQMWAEVGLNMAPRAVDGPTFVENFYRNGTFDITQVGAGAGADPHIPANNFFVCGQIYPGGFNGTRYCNDRASELVRTGARTVALEDRAPLYQELSQILNEELSMMPLWVGQALVAVGERVDSILYDQYNWDSIHEWTMR